jgi:hypothetical protein
MQRVWLSAFWLVVLVPLVLYSNGRDPEQAAQEKYYSHEPDGFTRLVELHFDRHGEAGWKDLSDDPEFDIVRTPDYQPEESSVSSVPAPPVGDDWIGVAKFFPYQTGGTAPINYILPADSAWNSENYNELFWGYWFMASTNHSVTKTGVNKIGFVEVGDTARSNGGSQIYFGLTGPATGTQDSFKYAVFNQGKPSSVFGGRWTCNLGRIIKAGTWHKIEHYTRLNTLTAQDSVVPNGIHRVWIDDVLCVDVDTLSFIGHPHAAGAYRAFSRIKWNPTYSSPSPPDTSYQFISHLYVSGKRSN